MTVSKLCEIQTSFFSSDLENLIAAYLLLIPQQHNTFAANLS